MAYPQSVYILLKDALPQERFERPEQTRQLFFPLQKITSFYVEIAFMMYRQYS